VPDLFSRNSRYLGSGRFLFAPSIGTPPHIAHREVSQVWWLSVKWRVGVLRWRV
jgi:hypothetical protein